MKPRAGNQRIVKAYAFLPTFVINEFDEKVIAWFKSFYRHQEYEVRNCHEDGLGSYEESYWVTFKRTSYTNDKRC